MKTYKILKSTYHWKNILSKIEPNNCILLNKGKTDFILAWGMGNKYVFDSTGSNINDFRNFIDSLPKTYLFGYFGYDLKNVLEPSLKSDNPDALGFNEMTFFEPKHILFTKNNESVYFGESSSSEIDTFLGSDAIENNNITDNNSTELKSETTKEDYIEHVLQIKSHIQRGDIYEMNYCIIFSGINNSISPIHTFKKLSELTNAPFSSFLNIDKHTVFCASPERFIKKSGNKIISQPIKGTAARGVNEMEDLKIISALESDKKERSENIMIVDLVRNDLSKIAEKKSVNVEKLCEIHSFKTVHQLISTISCSIKENTNKSEIIEAMFPMGSMTGAPKISAMEIAENHENFKRGIYSGAIGYFDPNGNFDFNVIIRSILYNKENGRISCSVGGAITSKSDPEKEYQECILKLEALKESLC